MAEIGNKPRESLNIVAAITKNTLVPISLVLAILWGVLVVNNRLLAIEYRLAEISADLINRTDDRYRASDMRHWIDLFRASNPELVIPDCPAGAEE